MLAGFDEVIGIEANEKYIQMANHRLEYWQKTVVDNTRIF
jgi:DNA modification methylase